MRPLTWHSGRGGIFSQGITAAILSPGGGGIKTQNRAEKAVFPKILWLFILCLSRDCGTLKIKFNGERERSDMKCPYCGYLESKVIDSRPANEGASIRRRRECLACQRRFTTYEIMERVPLVVVKRDGSRQTFDKSKLINSMLKACEKRSVALNQLEAIADDIEQSLQNALEREIPTSEVGEMVMRELKDLDEVAYVRFASVYRQFKDINTFMEELTRLLEDKEQEKP